MWGKLIVRFNFTFFQSNRINVFIQLSSRFVGFWGWLVFGGDLRGGSNPSRNESLCATLQHFCILGKKYCKKLEALNATERRTLLGRFHSKICPLQLGAF